MYLQTNTLRSREFLIQMFAILQEFGAEIPWLQPCKDSMWYTNKNRFRDEILRSLGSEENQIHSFGILDNDTQYIGGILHFTVSPERFQDSKSIDTQRRLEAEGFSYLTCLQIRDKFQRRRIGSKVMLETFSTLQKTYPKIWAVVSHSELLPWYISLGFKVEQTTDTRDNLWIISRNATAL